MISAFAIIHMQIPDTTLYIYGEGSERAYLEKLIGELSLTGSVFLPGRTDDVYSVLQNSDLYLMTHQNRKDFPMR